MLNGDHKFQKEQYMLDLGRGCDEEKEVAVMTKPFELQRLIWEESIQAVQDSMKFSNFDDFRSFLIENLPQSSSYTRKRYTTSILKWFFPNKELDSLSNLIWRHYQDETTLKDIMRYEYLSKEAIVSEFITEYLIPLEPGTKVSPDYIRNFIIRKYDEAKKDPLRCLSLACRDLGFIKRDKNILIVQGILEPKTALLILIHHIFAPRQRTIPIKEIIEHSFWALLGIRNQERIKSILKEADAKGLIAKYIIADHLEQITTKYSIQDFIGNRFKL